MSTTNVNLRGGATGSFANMSETGDVNVQAAYKAHLPAIRVRLSGGTDFLEPCPTAGVLIVNPPTNTGPVFVGGIADRAAYVNKTYVGDNFGTPIFPGQSWVDPVDDAAKVSLAGNKNDEIYCSYFLTSHTTPILNTTTLPPRNPPTFVSTSPVTGATGVTNISTFTATFANPLDPTTVNTTNVTISPAVAGWAVALDPTGKIVTMTVTAKSLAAGTVYTISFNNQVASANGAFTNPGTISFNFTTDPAPVAVTLFPAAGATAVVTNTRISIAYDHAMDQTTIGNVDYLISPAVTFNSFLDAGNVNQVDIQPVANLANSTTYTITAKATVADLAGFSPIQTVWSFTTAASAPPPAAPTVTSTTPPANGTGANGFGNITIAFSEAMDATTINNTNITLKTTAGSINQPSTVTLGGDTITVTVSPTTKPLTANTQFTITVSTAVKAAAGIGGLALASTFTCVFTVEPAPFVFSTNPANGATSVATSTDPVVTFSMAMKASTINSTNIYLTDSGGFVFPSTVSFDGLSNATIIPTSGFAQSSTYTIHVLAGCQNTDGYPMTANFTSSFTSVAPSYTLIYNITGNDSGVAVYDGNSSHVGFGMQLQDTTTYNPGDTSYPIYNAKIKKILVWLKKTTSSTLSGTIYCRIRAGSGTPITNASTIRATIGSIAASSVTSSSSYVQFTFVNDANTYALQKYDSINIEWPGTGSTSSGLKMDQNSGTGWSHGGNMTTELDTGNSLHEAGTPNHAAAMVIYV